MASGDVVRLLGAVVGVKSVSTVDIDALDRGGRVGCPFAFAANPESGADVSGRLDCRDGKRENGYMRCGSTNCHVGDLERVCLRRKQRV